MHSVEDIAKAIVGREGGYVNDPDDPGGATKHGVTIHTMRRLGLDLTKDGRVTREDVKRLTKTKAVEIYIRHYFDDPKIAQLPKTLQASVFDMYVNSGNNAVKILQRLFVKMGFDVDVDGTIGPQTMRIAHAAFRAAPNHLRDAYGIERRNYYYELADRRRASRKYARARSGAKGGWIRRAEEFISPKFHLTPEQHKQRTSSWA